MSDRIEWAVNFDTPVQYSTVRRVVVLKETRNTMRVTGLYPDESHPRTIYKGRSWWFFDTSEMAWRVQRSRAIKEMERLDQEWQELYKLLGIINLNIGDE